LIENYQISLANLGKAGITTVCYNFMPVIDWIRTDLEHKWADGASSLYYDSVKFAYFDCLILKREGAEEDYTTEELAKIYALDTRITEAEKERLIDTIIVKTQGFINGNIKEGDQNPVAIFNRMLKLYEGIDRYQLRENLRYFLAAITPVCDEWNINMCIHPDDPPRQVLGLPRIVTNEEDIAWLLNAVDNPHNGLTFCAGSLSSGIHNDVPDLARKFVARTHFVHLRSTNVFPDGNFIESGHLEGRGHLIELVRIFEQANPLLPFRVDHGRLMFDDAEKGYNPGYSFHGRMFALAQMDGVMATVKDEISKSKSIIQKQYSI
jgi:mannonate dehydratase